MCTSVSKSAFDSHTIGMLVLDVEETHLASGAWTSAIRFTDVWRKCLIGGDLWIRKEALEYEVPCPTLDLRIQNEKFVTLEPNGLFQPRQRLALPLASNHTLSTWVSMPIIARLRQPNPCDSMRVSEICADLVGR